MKDVVLYSVLSFLFGVICAFAFLSARINSMRKEKEEAKLDLIRLQAQIDNSSSMQENFKKIASEIINQTNSDVLEKNQDLLMPLKTELKEFKEKVELLKNTGIETTSALKEKIDTLRKDSLDLKTQTQSLTDSLKLNSKSRGIFGELVLEQILTSSGLVNKNEDEILGNYITQKGFKNALSPEERALIPDAVVFFPEEQKHIVVDSKCPLNYFQEFMEESDEDKKQECLKNYYSSLEEMIDELSGKYNSLEGLSTPEFKILFIPLEAAYLYTYEKSDLIVYANKKNVTIAGPSTLIAILKIIKECWDTKKISDNMTNLQSAGNSLYETFCVFISKLENLNLKFLSLNTAFQDTFTTIRGQKGLIKQFEKFKQMGLNPNKQISDKYLNESFEEVH